MKKKILIVLAAVAVLLGICAAVLFLAPWSTEIHGKVTVGEVETDARLTVSCRLWDKFTDFEVIQGTLTLVYGEGEISVVMERDAFDVLKRPDGVYDAGFAWYNATSNRFEHCDFVFRKGMTGVYLNTLGLWFQGN